MAGTDDMGTRTLHQNLTNEMNGLLAAIGFRDKLQVLEITLALAAGEVASSS